MTLSFQQNILLALNVNENQFVQKWFFIVLTEVHKCNTLETFFYYNQPAHHASRDWAAQPCGGDDHLNQKVDPQQELFSQWESSLPLWVFPIKKLELSPQSGVVPPDTPTAFGGQSLSSLEKSPLQEARVPPILRLGTRAKNSFPGGPGAGVPEPGVRRLGSAAHLTI